MTKQFKLGTLAFAVATLCAAPAFAQTSSIDGGAVDLGFGYQFDENININLDNTAEVIIEKKSRVTKSLEIDGKVNVTGVIDVTGAALSTTDNKLRTARSTGR